MAKTKLSRNTMPSAESKVTETLETQASQPAATVDGRLASKLIVERFSFQSLKNKKLQKHIERGCKLATQEELEDGDSTVSLTTGSTLAQTTVWKRTLAEHRTSSEPYPEGVNRKDEDERMDYDSDLANLSAFWFRSGELAERARDPQPTEVAEPLNWFPVKEENYTPLAILIDDAAQRTRDEEDEERREALVKPTDAEDDKEAVWCLASALSESLRFEERVLQVLSSSKYPGMARATENYDLRQLCAFMFRAGQLSGWR